MKKRIFLILFIAILFLSCGKKGDPVYDEKNQNSKIFDTQHQHGAYS
jgi:hypothetical protein